MLTDEDIYGSMDDIVCTECGMNFQTGNELEVHFVTVHKYSQQKRDDSYPLTDDNETNKILKSLSNDLSDCLDGLNYTNTINSSIVRVGGMDIRVAAAATATQSERGSSLTCPTGPVNSTKETGPTINSSIENPLETVRVWGTDIRVAAAAATGPQSERGSSLTGLTGPVNSTPTSSTQEINEKFNAHKKQNAGNWGIGSMIEDDFFNVPMSPRIPAINYSNRFQCIVCDKRFFEESTLAEHFPKCFDNQSQKIQDKPTINTSNANTAVVPYDSNVSKKLKHNKTVNPNTQMKNDSKTLDKQKQTDEFNAVHQQISNTGDTIPQKPFNSVKKVNKSHLGSVGTIPQKPFNKVEETNKSHRPEKFFEETEPMENKKDSHNTSTVSTTSINTPSTQSKTMSDSSKLWFCMICWKFNQPSSSECDFCHISQQLSKMSF
jgi:hypothetical protein